MIRLAQVPLNTLRDAHRALQMALQIEFGTLPPYLYALYSIKPETNAAATARVKSVVMQEMIHFCLDCNILNALGGSPLIADASVVPTYPGSLPGDLGGLTLHLLPFSADAMQQGMNIETPEDGPIDFPEEKLLAAPAFQTIGQFYHALDRYLASLPATAWHANRNQITDAQFLAGDLFAVNNYADAHRAIEVIVSEGEGSRVTPLDFAGELAHYYRFEEVQRNQLLTKADNPEGYAWGVPLGVDWTAAYPAIADPGRHDFSGDPPAAQAIQRQCNAAYSLMLRELQRAVNGEPARLGNAVRSMFELRMAALQAFNTPLADGVSVAGPAFLFDPN